MIGWLCGKILDVQQPGKLLLDVNGVGYNIEMSLLTFFQLEKDKFESVALHIHTVVREDAFILFGFLEKLERAVFRALIKVNGIGPKLALGILSNSTSSELLKYIQQQEVQRLVQLPGIGKKTAERLLIEMKDSLAALLPLDAANITQSSARCEVDSAVNALESLGYKFAIALKIVKNIDDGIMNCEQLIRLALKRLSNV